MQSSDPPLPKRPRRFAPLDPGKAKEKGKGEAGSGRGRVRGEEGEGVRVLKGVVFDVDGTLWLVFFFPSFLFF